MKSAGLVKFTLGGERANSWDLFASFIIERVKLKGFVVNSANEPPRDQCLPVQPISARKAQSRKKSPFARLVNFLIGFTNLNFSCSVQVHALYYMRKGS